MSSVLNELVEILVGGLNSMATGIAGGLNSMASALFVDATGTTPKLTTFGGIVAIFRSVLLYGRRTYNFSNKMDYVFRWKKLIRFMISHIPRIWLFFYGGILWKIIEIDRPQYKRVRFSLPPPVK